MTEGVLIHDPSPRTEKIAEKFLGVDCEIFCINEVFSELGIIKKFVREEARLSSERISTSNLPVIRLVLVHNSKKATMPGVGCECIIRYSTQSWKPREGTEYWINRGIDERENHLTENEAKALWEWAVHRKPDEIPEILLPPQKASMLYALTVLCQGYLAVHAKKENSEWGHIFPALKQMGWIDLMEGPRASFVFKSLPEKITVVSEAKWWLEPFDLLEGPKRVDENESRINKSRSERLEENLKREWDRTEKDLPDAFKNLLGEIEGGNIKEPKIVADVYCAIVEKLGDMPCPQH